MKNKMGTNSIKSETTEMLYKSLSPEKRIENGECYYNAIDFAIKDDSIKNIAITGVYGSGKSSILESYIRYKDEQGVDLKSINISMASFEEQNVVEENLQKELLKHLFYQVKNDVIPASRFRKIEEPKLKNSAVIVLTILLVYLAIDVCVGKCSLLINLENNIEILKTSMANNFVPYLLVYGLLIAVYICLTWLFYWFSIKIKIAQVKIFDKIEISQEKKERDDIAYSKYIDEILYFFEKTKNKVVFIEDLDRFRNNIAIYTWLRDINDIINNYEKIQGKVTFIYALKDDIFIGGEERTKFFDFIIPVIPYINSTNSAEQFRNRLGFEKGEQKSRKYNIDSDTIMILAPFVQDMRLLDNICNEFILYKNIISKQENAGEIDDKNLLSLMVFKGLYPKDFADLQKESGIVKEAFRAKIVYAKAVEEKNNLKVKEIQEKLSIIERQYLKNEEELKAVLWIKMACDRPFDEFTINNNFSFIKLSQYMKDISLKQLISNNVLVRNSNTGSRYTVNMNDSKYKDIFERYTLLCDDFETTKKQLSLELEKVNEEIRKYTSTPIKQLLLNGFEENLPSHVKENDILLVLLKNGLINENYVKCMNYFYENSITSKDSKFLSGIRRGVIEIEMSDNLEMINQLVSYHMIVDDFRKEEVFNVSLTDFLLQYCLDEDKCDLYFKTLSRRTEYCKKFILNYLEQGVCKQLFIKKIAQYNKYYWLDLLNSNLSEEKEQVYFSEFLKNADVSDIVLQDRECSNIISQRIRNRENILKELSIVEQAKKIEIIEGLEIIFSNTFLEGEIVPYIIDNSLYAVNEFMLSQVLLFYNIDNNLIQNANYDAVLSCSNENVIEYVHNNIVDYVNNLILYRANNVNDSVDNIISMVNRLDKDMELVLLVIQHEEYLIDDLQAVDSKLYNIDNESKKSIYNEFIVLKKVRASWSNIDFYFSMYGITPELSDFIDKSIDDLVKETYVLEQSFIDAIVKNTRPMSNFGVFAKRYINKPINYAMKSLEYKRLEFFIKMGYYEVNLENLQETRKIGQDVQFLFWENNISDIVYFNDTLLDNISIDMFEKVYFSQKIDKSLRERLLFGCASEKVTETIAIHIAQNKLNISRELLDLVWKKIIIYQDKSYCVEFIMNYAPKLSHALIDKYIITIGEPYSKLVRKEKQHKENIIFSELNWNFVKALNNNRYFGKYEKNNSETLISVNVLKNSALRK